MGKERERNKDLQKDPVPAESPSFVLASESHIDERGYGAECPDDDGVGPFRVGIFMFFVRCVEVFAVETADRDSEDELQEAEGKEENEERERYGGASGRRGRFLGEAGEGHF